MEVEEVFHAHINQMRAAGVAILTPEKIDVKSKPVTRDHGGQCIMIKVSIHQ